MKKILVSDFDGTFFRNEEELKKNILDIKKFRDDGNIFVIATGRAWKTLYPFITKYKIEYDYLILNSGCTIVDNKGNLLKDDYMKLEIKNNLLKDLDILNIEELFISGNNNRVTCKDDDYITKINFSLPTIEEAKKISNFINKKYDKLLTSYATGNDTEVGIDIIPYNINKAIAISQIKIVENVEDCDIYVIGDSFNDMEMIREFNGYCVKNSTKELIDLCGDKIIENVSELLSKIYMIK